MTVGRDGDQLVPGAAAEFQYAPALPIGVGPVEVDCGPAAREHEVVQPRVRVERFTHEAPPPSDECSRWPQIRALASVSAAQLARGSGRGRWNQGPFETRALDFPLLRPGGGDRSWRPGSRRTSGRSSTTARAAAPWAPARPPVP